MASRNAVLIWVAVAMLIASVIGVVVWLILKTPWKNGNRKPTPTPYGNAPEVDGYALYSDRTIDARGERMVALGAYDTAEAAAAACDAYGIAGCQFVVHDRNAKEKRFKAYIMPDVTFSSVGKYVVNAFGTHDVYMKEN